VDSPRTVRGFITIRRVAIRVRVTFVAHATVLVEDDGATALFDPNYSKRLAYVFNKRKVPLPVRPERLPTPDTILVSHDHYDHLDAPSVKRYDKQTPVVVPRNLRRVVNLMGRRRSVPSSGGRASG
jgi:L-ascorbate metabolism protein UlaG (beta-lactamase superfamily)